MEQFAQLFPGHSNTSVPDRELQCYLIIGFFHQFNINQDFALFSEFDCIVCEVNQDLAKPERIAHQNRWYLRVAFEQELKPFFLGFDLRNSREIFQHLVNFKFNFLDIQPACLNLGEIQDIVDDAEQRLGRSMDL